MGPGDRKWISAKSVKPAAKVGVALGGAVVGWEFLWGGVFRLAVQPGPPRWLWQRQLVRFAQQLFGCDREEKAWALTLTIASKQIAV